MKKPHKYYSVAGALCVLLLLLFTACEQNSEPSPSRLGWDYYPLSQGAYRLYDVYRINYNFTDKNDTLSYELKEQIAEYFINQQQDTVYVLRRYQRSNPEAAWKLDSAYMVQRTTRWLIQTSNNKPQLHLAFPVGEGLIWNANMLNAAKPDDFTIMQLGKAYEVDDKIYENALVVEQENLTDPVVKTDIRHEVYASGIGMVYKRSKILNYCTDKSCEGVTGRITTGLFLEMKLKETGTEPQ